MTNEINITKYISGMYQETEPELYQWYQQSLNRANKLAARKAVIARSYGQACQRSNR